MSAPYAPQQPPRKLTRSTTNKFIGGVCGGLAEYLNMDVNLVRILTVVISLFTGVPIILYLVALFLLPEDRSVQDPPPVTGPIGQPYGAAGPDTVWGAEGAPWEQRSHQPQPEPQPQFRPSPAPGPAASAPATTQPAAPAPHQAPAEPLAETSAAGAGAGGRQPLGVGRRRPREPGGADRQPAPTSDGRPGLSAADLREPAPGHSHSMVPGGLLVMSTTTRLTSRTSLVIRVLIFSSTS